MDDRHGTTAEYQQHRLRGEEACDACKSAQRDYTKAYRAKNPKKLENNRQYMQARDRALMRLKEAHAEEFEKLMTEERNRQGLPRRKNTAHNEKIAH